MHVITVSGHEPGDYLHPDQRLEVIDEATGKKYELYLRSNAMAPVSTGEISLFVPVAVIRQIQADEEYCVLTLSHVITEREAKERRDWLAGISIGLGRRAAPQTRRRRGTQAVGHQRSKGKLPR